MSSEDWRLSNNLHVPRISFAFLIFSLATIIPYGDLLEVDPVYLSVSSLYRAPSYGAALIDRELQLHWDPNVFTKVALFTSDPTLNSDPILQIESENHTEGYYETNITIGNPEFPAGWEKSVDSHRIPGDHCLPFWLGAYINNDLVHIQCLHIRPTWMFDNRLSIGGLSLLSLFLPGTHNSGCFRRGESLSKRDTTARYLLTQDQDVWSQLVYGVRYIDLRVGIYPIRRKNGSEELDNDNNFWVNHDLVKVRHLVPVLRDIRQFLEATRGEVVILDLHRFPVGFSGRHHRHHCLVKVLRRELGEFALPFTGTWPTLDTIWDQNRSLVISYGDEAVVKENDWLWPPVKQMWGNQQSLLGLYGHLEKSMNDTKSNATRPGLWAAMAQLTPSPLDLLFNPTGNLRLMAHEVNRHLSEWCEDLWWDKANIFATDFFLENNVINIAIAANIQKGNILKQYDLIKNEEDTEQEGDETIEEAVKGDVWKAEEAEQEDEWKMKIFHDLGIAQFQKS